MLDERTLALARKTLRTELRDLEDPFTLRIGGWKNKLHGNGRLYIYIAQEYRREVNSRAGIIWRNLLRAHNTFGALSSDSLRRDLLEEFRSQLDALTADLTPRFQADMQGCPANAKLQGALGDARDHELARHDAEIDHYVGSLEAAASRGATASGGYNFYGTVGAVITGPGAVANIVQNIAPEHQKTLLDALLLVREALASAPELPERDRLELIEFADEAESEVRKEAPNGRRLSLVLQTLSAAVQGMASAAPAYEAIRSAAAAIGILI